MAQVLQLPQLVELDGVPEMEVGPGRIEAFLDPQRLAARELRDELALDDQLVGAALEYGEVVIEVEGHGARAPRPRGRFVACGRIAASPGSPDHGRAQRTNSSAKRPQDRRARPLARQWIALAVLALSGVAAFALAPGTLLPAPPPTTVVRALSVPSFALQDGGPTSGYRQRRSDPARRHDRQRARAPRRRRSASARFPDLRSRGAAALPAATRPVAARVDRRRRCPARAPLPHRGRRPADDRARRRDAGGVLGAGARGRALEHGGGRDSLVAVRCRRRCRVAGRGHAAARRRVRRGDRLLQGPATRRPVRRRMGDALGRRRDGRARAASSLRSSRAAASRSRRSCSATRTGTRATTRPTARRSAARSCARRWSSRA